MLRFVLAGLISFHALGMTSSALAAPLRPSKFHSAMGREREVMFTSYFRSQERDTRAFANLNERQRREFEEREILPLMDFLFGPLTHRTLGNPQRTARIDADWNNLRVREGRVEIPYRYVGLWLVNKQLSRIGEFDLPVPVSLENVYSPAWKRCGDSDPEHQTRAFYWYFWDPERTGCDHREGRDYVTVRVRLGRETINQTNTMPEYAKLLEGGLRMTIAFGYAKDPLDPNPAADPDEGVDEFRAFVSDFRRKYGAVLASQPIRQGEYRYVAQPNKIIGERFTGKLNGVDVTVNIVVAAGVDQMDIFAKSYAHDHDDVFAWFGHSRVGGAFDADTFRSMLREDPQYYSLANSYQVIYWGGCNSYSYYTQPFFELRAETSGGRDPRGTKLLDIVANGLPSYFMFNAANAMITADMFLNFQQPKTYQSMIQSIESIAARMGLMVLSVVLGDEDNGE
ncbi:MAG: hypothetical protein NDI61_03450 [Bdellovibrionaceae bacterium]|nr:hypothetical protein [Pseudobdellovibrionaceae bacterium]